MLKKKTQLIIIIIFLNFANSLFASENFFKDAIKKYNEKKFEDAKFLFQRNIVFNPKDTKSYLYLAKIYNNEENQKEELKNINTVILLDPKNEEAVYMLIKIDLKKSNYLEVKKLLKTFLVICNNLCEKEKSVLEALTNIEPKNES
jgi:tetratricopeptide (TPR) repeat protein